MIAPIIIFYTLCTLILAIWFQATLNAARRKEAVDRDLRSQTYGNWPFVGGLGAEHGQDECCAAASKSPAKAAGIFGRIG